MILVFLGNFEKKYHNTRHNVGRAFGHFLTTDLGIKNETKKKFGQIVDYNNGWQGIFLDCFMNSSGQSLADALDTVLPDWKNKENFQELFLVHDDLDIPLGEFKIQFGRGAAGHHGVESVVDSLGSNQFWRIRIGINRPPVGIEGEDFVLMPFSKEERNQLKDIFQVIFKTLVRNE